MHFIYVSPDSEQNPDHSLNFTTEAENLFKVFKQFIIYRNRVCDVRNASANTSSAADTSYFAADLLRYISAFTVNSMPESCFAVLAEIMIARYGRKVFQKTSVPCPETFAFFEFPVNIVLDIEAVTRRTNQVARSA